MHNFHLKLSIQINNMFTSVTPTKLADDVHKTSNDAHKTSNDAEAFNQTHILISYDKTHAFNGTSSDYLPSGYLHKFMELVQLRHDDIASVINLSDYPLTVPQLLSSGLKLAHLTHSVDHLSLRESIAKFERSLRLAKNFDKANNSDFNKTYYNRHNKF